MVLKKELGLREKKKVNEVLCADSRPLAIKSRHLLTVLSLGLKNLPSNTSPFGFKVLQQYPDT